jgi:DamX protein
MPLFNKLFTKKYNSFYATSELTQRIDLLKYLVKYSEQLILITGKKGYGKTTLLNQLQTHQVKNWKLLTLNSSPKLDFDSLISKLLIDLNVRPEGKSSAVLLEALHSHLAATHYNGHLPILLVDDAHLLSANTFRLLTNLLVNDNVESQDIKIKIILFAEESLIKQFYAIGGLEQSHIIDIPTFSEQQVSGYLQSYLQQAKYSINNPFNENIVKNVYKISNGVAEQVDIQARRILDRYAVKKISTNSKNSHTSVIKNNKKISNLFLVLITVIILIISGLWLKNKLSVNNTQLTDKSNKPVQLPPLDVMPTDNIIELKPPNEKFEEIPANKLTIKSANWIKRQLEDNYTIQLSGAYKEQQLKELLNKYKLEGEIATFKSVYKNKDWYILIYGVYSDAQQAQQALKKLPVNLRKKNQPWVRQFKSVISGLK